MRTWSDVERLAVQAGPAMFALWAGAGAWKMAPHMQLLVHVRIRRLSAYLAQGRLRFQGNSQGAGRLVGELRDFPFGDHDDGPDALEMAVRLAEGLLSVPANDPGFTVERVWTG